ncbi:mitochondrial thiamine pyrophosphate carrier [Drosophila montana]|uniref:mitochondrial thiamine pyrophosphate carrier n=1 Tax=Drosophila montana TaxID=40370 RepID=UPI00313CC775
MREKSPATSKNSTRVQLLQAIGGGVSGAITRFVTQPFDVLKIRFQLQVEPLKRKSLNSKYSGMLNAFASIYREEGLRGVWKGHIAAQMMSITYALVQFWSYEQLHRAAHQNKFFNEHTHLSYFMCGGLAGCMGTILAQPFDVIRTRVVAADPGSSAGSLKPVSGVGKIFKQEGMRGVSSGMMMTLIQIYPLVGANFVIYKFCNRLALTLNGYFHDDPKPNHRIPGPLLFFNGAVAGVLSKMLVYPADLVKKRTMLSHFQHDRKTFGTNPNCDTVMHCIRTTYEREGWLGFYKGMLPTLYKSGVMSAFYFTIYDYFNRNITIPYQKHETAEKQERQEEEKKKKEEEKKSVLAKEMEKKKKQEQEKEKEKKSGVKRSVN